MVCRIKVEKEKTSDDDDDEEEVLDMSKVKRRNSFSFNSFYNIKFVFCFVSKKKTHIYTATNINQTIITLDATQTSSSNVGFQKVCNVLKMNKNNKIIY